MHILQKFILWVLLILLFLSGSNESVRHFILPDDATATDSVIIFIQLVILEFLFSQRGDSE